MASSVIPHNKVQLQSVPVLKGERVKMMYTTGSITKRNYIQRKAGQKAEHHHVFGALYVEIDSNGDYFARQLIANSEDGSFYDLDRFYSNGSVSNSDGVDAVTWGDIHSEMLDEEVAQGSWRDQNSILDILKPKYQFVHDLTDFSARNHHNIKNPHFLAKRYFENKSNVEYGMKQSADVLKELERPSSKIVVVESNHDQAFKRWLAEADIRQDPENAEYYHISNAEIFKNIRLGKEFNVFEWAVRRFGDMDNVVFLNEDDSFIVNGIENAIHGHRGSNGARGGANGFKKLSRRVNVAHSHTAMIIDGVYVAGISCKLDMGYNKGASSWSHSHIITHKNGKRQLITMVGSKWRA